MSNSENMNEKYELDVFGKDSMPSLGDRAGPKKQKQLRVCTLEEVLTWFRIIDKGVCVKSDHTTSEFE